MTDDDLITVFSAIAETLLETDLVVSGAAAPGVPGLTARMDFRGEFTGALTATVSLSLARKIAAAMMKSGSADYSQEDLRDALGEVVNIAAGNLRGLLSSQCQIGLPQVRDSGPVWPGETQRCVARASLKLFGQPMQVELREG